MYVQRVVVLAVVKHKVGHRLQEQNLLALVVPNSYKRHRVLGLQHLSQGELPVPEIQRT